MKTKYSTRELDDVIRAVNEADNTYAMEAFAWARCAKILCAELDRLRAERDYILQSRENQINSLFIEKDKLHKALDEARIIIGDYLYVGDSLDLDYQAEKWISANPKESNTVNNFTMGYSCSHGYFKGCCIEDGCPNNEEGDKWEK